MNTQTARNQKLVSSTLMGLVGRNVAGIKCQVRNPIYIDAETPAQWRTLKAIRTYKENHKMWVELSWEREIGDSCDFTGCTQVSDCCKVQFTHAEFNKMLAQSK
jgi:hypothetical protein